MSQNFSILGLPIKISGYASAVYMIKAKAAFLEGRLLSSQSGVFENFLDCSDWLASKKPLLFRSCKQAIN